MPEFDPFNPPAEALYPQGTEPYAPKVKEVKSVKYPQSSLLNPAPVVTSPLKTEIMPAAPVLQGGREQYAVTFGTAGGGGPQIRYKRSRKKANQSRPRQTNRLARAKRSRTRSTNNPSPNESKETPKKKGQGHPAPVWLKKYQFKKGNKLGRNKK